jgi:Kef-type K+ transport system membrane component KefB
MAVVLLAPILAERARIPGVVGLVVVGVLIGPHTSGLLERDGTIAVLGSVGLLYLMFVVGLELDLEDFSRHRRGAVLFGVATFVIPMALGTALIPLLGFELLPSILLASCWASHTLVAYPVYRRLGTASSRAVSVSVGATIVTDTAALLVLVVVARAHVGGLDARFWATLVPSLAALLLLLLVGLPRLARWFFSQLGQDRAARFGFLLVALFASAGLAELAGIEGIIGAFLAGLALNRMVPAGSALMERVEFFGSSFLIPLFLVAVGMLVDPRVFTEAETLWVGLGFTAIALVAKWLAAWLTGTVLRYDRAEIGTMFSLSGAQAAATLAAVVVGLQVGLIGEETVNAVIAVILITCLVTSATAGRYAPRLSQPPARRALGETVLVPVARPESAAPLMRFAAAVARRDSGTVVPLVVVAGGPAPERLAGARALAAEAGRHVLAQGGHADATVRIDVSASAGSLHVAAERGATFIVLGWKGYTSRRESLFGGVIDDVVQAAPVPVVVTRLHDRPVRRVLVLVGESGGGPAERSGLHLAVELAGRLSGEGALPVAVHSATDDPLVDVLAQARLKVRASHDPRRRPAMARALAGPDDLILLPVAPDATDLNREAARVAQAVPEASVVTVIDSAARRVRPPDAAEPESDSTTA